MFLLILHKLSLNFYQILLSSRALYFVSVSFAYKNEIADNDNNEIQQDLTT